MELPGKPDAGRSTRVLIIGSGFAGIGMAVRLRERGITDIVILERAPELGGTWRDNVYPGCACDVESTLYSFSFAPNPRWSHSFSSQSEIQEYLLRVATEHGIRPLIHFNEEVTGARWDDVARAWTVRSTSGEWRADAVVMANGALSDPRVPAFPGLEQFGGPVFHTARWDARAELRGKRVAVIGTGASAIQVIPAIQPEVAELVVVQRTPAWVLPRFDHVVPEWRKRLYAAAPFAQRLVRAFLHLRHETLFIPFRHPHVRRAVEWILRWNLRRQVRDPSLRRSLAPDYGIGCKRLLLSDDYYPAMTRPNVRLVTSPLESVRPDGIVTADGRAHAVDVIVLATGFRVTDPILAPHVVGRGGRSLAESWAGSPRAYMGTTVTDFPNLFLLMGPNTGLGHSSVVMMAEAQVEHVLGVLGLMAAKGARAAEPRAEAQAGFVRWMDESLASTVWNTGGCDSWYIDRTGRNSVLWPFGVDRFRRTVRRVRAGDYALLT